MHFPLKLCFSHRSTIFYAEWEENHDSDRAAPDLDTVNTHQFTRIIDFVSNIFSQSETYFSMCRPGESVFDAKRFLKSYLTVHSKLEYLHSMDISIFRTYFGISQVVFLIGQRRPCSVWMWGRVWFYTWFLWLPWFSCITMLSLHSGTSNLVTTKMDVDN